jgi:hypothetical protein
MGQRSAETVKEIEEIRGRLSTDLDELQDRLPAPAVWGKRVLGVAAGGGLAGTLFWFGIRRLRRKRQPKRSAPVQAVVQVLPEDLVSRVTEKLDDERVRQWLFALGGAWLLFRLAELRQLRKLQRGAFA